MEPNLETVNNYLVSAFNDILTIEESELKRSQFNDLSITEMYTTEAIGIYKRKTSSEAAKELSIIAGTLIVAINNLVKKGHVERLRSEDDWRVVKLGLTRRGKLLSRAHQYFHREMVKNILEGMEQEEEQVLLRTLRNLHDFLQEYKQKVRIPMKNHVRISCTSRYVSGNCVTNHQLNEMMNTSDEWIYSWTGISECRIVAQKNTSDLCHQVAKQLLEKSGEQANETDSILVATVIPDFNMPPVVCQVQGVIGATEASAFDISVVCSGFVYTLSMTEKLVLNGRCQTGLVIGGEIFSKMLDWTDRSTVVLLDDGAAGVLIEVAETSHLLNEKLQVNGQW